MQAWIDRHTVLSAVSFVLVLYLSVSFVISRWSGWATLARRFRTRSKFVGSRWHGQSAQMRWGCNYGACLTVGANSTGIYLSTLPFFPLLHPPLFIPWTEISVPSLSFGSVGFNLGCETSIPFLVQVDLAERLKRAAGRGYPVETIGSWK
jgi:hypothetical protein